MILTADELEMVNKCMQTYAIKYQEVYDEISDHMITAIEIARKNGDQRAVETVFNEIFTTHFPGNNPMRKIQLKYMFAYHKKSMKMMWANFRYYLNWQTSLSIIILTITGFYLPLTERTNEVILRTRINEAILAWLMVISWVPAMYAIAKWKKVQKGKKKLSLISDSVVFQAQMLTLVLYFIIYVCAFVPKVRHITFLNLAHYHPVVYILLFSFIVIYTLSSIRLSKQELKVFGNPKINSL